MLALKKWQILLTRRSSVLNNPDKDPQPNSKLPSERGFSSGYAVGLNLFSSVLVGVVFGLGLDVWLGTKPLFILIFMFLGMAAGFRSIWAYMKRLENYDKK